MKADNNIRFFVAKKTTYNPSGFGYQTKNQPRLLWDGRGGWTTDKNQAVGSDNHPSVRMIAARLSDVEIISL